MKNTLKTTFEQRIEIVTYCLEHNKDYKSTCLIFNCNYAQLYSWVKKYTQYGEEGLRDRRGKKKEETQLTEIEKLQRKNKQLEREKEEYKKKYELLKKAEERERW